MINNIIEIPDDLIEAIATNKCVLFAGAGVSRATVNKGSKNTDAYLPTWEGLLIRLNDRAVSNGNISLNEGAKLHKAIKEGKYLFAAETARRILGAKEFDDTLEGIFRNPDLRPSNRHKLISRLPFNCIVTTNYDKLLEATYAQNGYIPPTYTFSDAPDVISALANNRFFILKAHGDIDRKETLVFSEKDYRDIIYRQPGYRAALNTIFITRTVLFIGTSLNDVDIKLVLESVSESFSGKGPRHFALVPAQSISNSELQYWKEFFGIQLITYKATAGHPELDKILERIDKKVKNQKTKK